MPSLPLDLPGTQAGLVGAGGRALIAGLDWARIGAELDAFGCATTGPLLDAAACARLSPRCMTARTASAAAS